MSGDAEKRVDGNNHEGYAPSSDGMGMVDEPTRWQYLKHYCTSREGWIGDYVCFAQVVRMFDFAS